jgi:hypothetical protein
MRKVGSQQFKVRIRNGVVLLDGSTFRGLVVGDGHEAVDLSQRILKQGLKLITKGGVDDGGDPVSSMPEVPS